MMRDEEIGKAILGILVLIIGIAGIYGWVMNIVAIAHSEFIPLTGLLVLRIVGIFIGPLGAVLGYV